MSNRALLRLGADVIRTEIDALRGLLPRIDDEFARACTIILERPGRVIVTGMGKSGHVGHKVASTLASAGTPSFFVHPGEASHGDLGMITREDTVMAFSNSGETAEILTIVPLIKRIGVPLLALTGNPSSRLASEADVNIDVSVAKEACPLGLAPTASTTAALAMGDAIAIALLEARDFGAEDFARSHPGGHLGRRLLLRVKDLMHTGRRMPTVGPDTLTSDALLEMTAKSLGMTSVVDGDGLLLGVFTDGDLRRALDDGIALRDTPIRQVMTPSGVTVSPDTLAAECLNILEQRKITALVVVDESYRQIGVLHLHDLLRAGVI
ncbi:MAG: KpsF/GutQ family sugar-phosphate isomerase [Immundisolibacterales bacterium]|nr:KpsF/GutQ family sugar-phosphate isomerase [Immundisolibacterales bacterium]